MFYCFEEKDRAKIEDCGISIVQAKKVLYAMVNLFGRIYDVCKNMSIEQMQDFLKDCEEKANACTGIQQKEGDGLLREE